MSKKNIILLNLTNFPIRYYGWSTNYLINLCLWALLATFLLVNLWIFQGTLRSPLNAPKMTQQHLANPSKMVRYVCNTNLFIWTPFLVTEFIWTLHFWFTCAGRYWWQKLNCSSCWASHSQNWLDVSMLFTVCEIIVWKLCDVVWSAVQISKSELQVLLR